MTVCMYLGRKMHKPVALTTVNAAESVGRNGKKSYKPFPDVLTETRSSILYTAFC